jgi:hypothetical protein
VTFDSCAVKMNSIAPPKEAKGGCMLISVSPFAREW